MIRLYYGRETIDKEKFIFENILNSKRKTLVIVPEQYTLEGEKQGLKYMNKKALMDVEITSLSRLGSRILDESPRRNDVFLNQYGRHILLSKLLTSEEFQLEVFENVKDKMLFIQQVNDFVSKAKQFNVMPAELEAASRALGEEYSYSKAKLNELARIYAAYEEAIKDVYTDSEDLLALYAAEAGRSSVLRDKEIWVYGFDSFTPKNLQYLLGLAPHVENMNIWLTLDYNCKDEDLFSLGAILEKKLAQEAAMMGLGFSSEKVEDERYSRKLNPVTKTIERRLFSVDAADDGTTDEEDNLKVMRCAGYYNEAHSICSEILSLAQKGMSYKDMVILNNDETKRGSILKRTLEEFGIGVFTDGNRKVINSPVCIFVLSLIEVTQGGFKTPDVLRHLKSYMSDLESDELDFLESYVVKYRINGNLWTRDFTKGLFEYGEDGLARINELRERAISHLILWKKHLKDEWTYGEYLEAYFDFLRNEVSIENRIEKLAKQQESLGLTEESAVTLQVWKSICNVAEQIHLLMADEPLDLKLLHELFVVGLEQIEVGTLPQGRDQVLIGTMQRTRIGSAKAVFVMGAVDGKLPLGQSEEGLLGWDDLVGLEELGHSIAFSRKAMAMEENLAIYRNLIRAEELLMITYSISGLDGQEEKPSPVVDKIMALFKGKEFELDYQSRNDIVAKLGGKINSGRQYLDAVEKMSKGDVVEPGWSVVENWFALSENQGEFLNRLHSDNVQEALGEVKGQQLFFNGEQSGPVRVSPSRLESFSKCPFAHFIKYGLRPQEWRLFSAASREIGDVYHEITRRFIEYIKLNDSILAPQLTDENVLEFADEMIDQILENYREGVFKWSLKEAYLGSRIKEVGKYLCLRLMEQLRSGAVKDVSCELSFGYSDSQLAPIVINTAAGTIHIAGKIDRVDEMASGKVAVIDYKTGNECFDIDEAVAGYRLQLMLYLEGSCQNRYEPLGVFYFHIGEKTIERFSLQEDESDLAIKAMGQSLVMNGTMINYQDDIKAFVNDGDDLIYENNLLDLKLSKDNGDYVEKSRNRKGLLLTENEFKTLQEKVRETVDELGEKLLAGNIEVSPLWAKSGNPCKYCQYTSICMAGVGLAGGEKRFVRKSNILQEND